MPEHHEFGPLTLTCEGDQYRFALSTLDQIELNIPPHYERTLTERLAQVLPKEHTGTLTLDLQQRSALSSRHLGVMLALQKALRERSPRLRLSGVHDNIRRLLATTRIAQFFEIVE